MFAFKAAESIDFITAKVSKLNHSLLNKVSDRTINEITIISSFVYDVSIKAPATIDWD